MGLKITITKIVEMAIFWYNSITSILNFSVLRAEFPRLAQNRRAKRKGVLGVRVPKEFLPACLSCEAGLRISARRRRRRAVKSRHRDFPEKRFEF